MINVSDKKITKRIAIAEASVFMKQETLKAIRENKLQKKDPIETARIAGILAAKKVDELIPLCHPLQVEFVDIEFQFNKNSIKITARVESTGKTGVEMEALVAVSVSSLTIYDMAKAIDKNIIIKNIMLLEKRGGKSGVYKRE